MADFSYLPQLEPNPLISSLTLLAKEPMTLNLDTSENLSSILSSKKGQHLNNNFLFSPPFFTLTAISHPIKFQQAILASKDHRHSLNNPRSKKSIFYYCSIDSDTRPTHLMECPMQFFSIYRPKVSDELYETLVKVRNLIF